MFAKCLASGVYVDEKFIGLICDNQLFVKRTEAGEEFLEIIEEGLPHEGPKSLCFIISNLEDKMFLKKIIKATAKSEEAKSRTETLVFS